MVVSVRTLELDFQWTSTFKLLGIHLMLIWLTFQNWTMIKKKLLKIKQIINQWSKRHIMPLGRTTLIKSFLISQKNHLFIFITFSFKKLYKKSQGKILNFLWQSKVDKLKRKQIIQDNINGGLKMTDMNSNTIELKSSWIKRIIQSTDTK